MTTEERTAVAALIEGFIAVDSSGGLNYLGGTLDGLIRDAMKLERAAVRTLLKNRQAANQRIAVRCGDKARNLIVSGDSSGAQGWLDMQRTFRARRIEDEAALRELEARDAVATPIPDDWCL